MLNSFGEVQPVQHVVTWVSKFASAPVTIMAPPIDLNFVAGRLLASFYQGSKSAATLRADSGADSGTRTRTLD